MIQVYQLRITVLSHLYLLTSETDSNLLNNSCKNFHQGGCVCLCVQHKHSSRLMCWTCRAIVVQRLPDRLKAENCSSFGFSSHAEMFNQLLFVLIHHFIKERRKGGILSFTTFPFHVSVPLSFLFCTCSLHFLSSVQSVPSLSSALISEKHSPLHRCRSLYSYVVSAAPTFSTPLFPLSLHVFFPL